MSNAHYRHLVKTGEYIQESLISGKFSDVLSQVKEFAKKHGITLDQIELRIQQLSFDSNYHELVINFFLKRSEEDINKDIDDLIAKRATEELLEFERLQKIYGKAE